MWAFTIRLGCGTMARGVSVILGICGVSAPGPEHSYQFHSLLMANWSDLWYMNTWACSDCTDGCIFPYFCVYSNVCACIPFCIYIYIFLITWKVLQIWRIEVILKLETFWELNEAEILLLLSHCFASKQKMSTVAQWPLWNVCGLVSVPNKEFST